MQDLWSKQQVVQTLLKGHSGHQKNEGSAFAPANIALVKYWGKRQSELNLPQTSSLSLSLKLGTHTKVSFCSVRDKVIFNGKELALDDPKALRLLSFCDLFRPANHYFCIDTKNDIPTGAGLASSASGFAALTLSLNDLFGWNLDRKSLSIFARMGSGSASRSLYSGFVLWHEGMRSDGLDSFAEPLNCPWPELCLGLLLISDKEKPIDSGRAMQRTVATSPLYSAWKGAVERDLASMQIAIQKRDFVLLGKTAETNALAMHATMVASDPPILYWLPESVQAMHKIWKIREMGTALYFTMDAGPNLKLLFLEKDKESVQSHFPDLQVLT